MNRNIRKGAVELLVALSVAALGWFANEAASLGINPVYLAVFVPVALSLRRALRDAFGVRPA